MILTQYAWTINTESLLDIDEESDGAVVSLESQIKRTQDNLQSLVELVREGHELPRHQAIVSLITSEVHNRDILEEMSTLKVANINEFIWQ